jgi:hypothetical protein
VGLLNMSRGSGSPRRIIRSDSRVFTVFAVNFYFIGLLIILKAIIQRIEYSDSILHANCTPAIPYTFILNIVSHHLRAVMMMTSGRCGNRRTSASGETPT